MYAMPRHRTRLLLASVAALIAVCTAPAAAPGRSIFHNPECDQLCGEDFWADAGAEDVAAALAEQPAALGYRRTMLWLAVQAGNAPAARALLRAGAPPNGRKHPGKHYFVLQAAVEHGKEVVDVLLEAGAFPDVAIGSGGCLAPLHMAVHAGKIGAVASLLEAGADPLAPDCQGLTAVGLARHSQAGDDLLALLLAPPAQPPPCGKLCEAEFWNTASPEDVRIALMQAPATRRWSASGGSPLHVALAAGADEEMVELLLDHGIDPNGRDRRDDTPLHVAARQPGGAGPVALLLQRGADLEALNGRDWTPLHAASERAASLASMHVLLDAGADPDVKAGHWDARTPRQHAVAQPGGSAAARLILSYPGPRDTCDPRYIVEIDDRQFVYSNAAEPRVLASLLDSAAQRGHPGTVELLLGWCDIVDPENRLRSNALVAASGAGNVETMRVLLGVGASIDASTDDEPQFANLATWRSLNMAALHPRAVELLLAVGAHPDGHYRSLDTTPLHEAASACSSESLLLLLEHGADPNAQGADEDTPLHNAVWRVAHSEDNDRYRQEELAACDADDAEKAWYLEECRDIANRRFRDHVEARDECVHNIKALLRFGANPNIPDRVQPSGGGHTPLDIATQQEVRERIGANIVRMMEAAARNHAR